MLGLWALVAYGLPVPHASEPATVWWNASWQYRKAVTVTAPAAPIPGLPAGYAVKLTFDHAAMVTGGKALATGDDVRIVFWNGTGHVEVDRVLEVGSAWNTATTSVWFNTSTALTPGAADNNYTVYYGHPGAGPAPASPAVVWLLWEDFESGYLDPAKWTVSTSSVFPPSIAPSGGQLQITGTTYPSNYQYTFGIKSVATLSSDFMVESSVSILTQSSQALSSWSGQLGLGRDCGTGLAVGSFDGVGKRLGCWSGSYPFSTWTDLAASGLTGLTFNDYRVGQALLSDGSARHYENGVLKATQAGLGTGARVVDLGYGPMAMYVTFDVRFDNIRVRKFVGADAATSAGPEVQPSPAPTLGAISPTSLPAGASAFTLSATGSSFVAGSVVRWNGSNRTTTFVSATQLQASVLASDLSTPGTPQVTVFTPSPGGGTSAPRTFTVTSAATKLAITSVNGGASPTAGAGFSVVVAAQNASGQPAAVGTATAVSLSRKTGTGTLGGTLSGTIASGATQVTISGATYSKAEGGVALTATRTSGESLTAGDSAAFTVNAGTASVLAFTTQPGNTGIGTAIPGPPTVTVRDSQGNTVTSSTASITVAIGMNPGGGTLGGTTTRNATAGVASFTGLTISAAGSGYTLTAAAAGLTGTTSAAFSISAAPTSPGISGTVSRAADGHAIGGATVEALQGGIVRATRITGADGSYAMTGLTAGVHDVRASADGYVTGTQTGVTVPSSGRVTVNLSLAASPPPGSITYLHDRLSRLVGVVNPTGETAFYRYDAVGNLLAIDRQSSATVVVVDFSPGGGPVGTSVRVSGTGFSTTPSQNTVRFNGVTAVVSSSSATEIVATVPAGATHGPISVTTPAGSATSTSSFTVGGSAFGAPTIAGFTPAIGLPGTIVTVTGTNFDSVLANDKTKLNVANVTVSTPTPTTLTATVPEGTGSGRFRVTTPGGTATSTADFFIPPPGYATTSVAFTGRMGVGDSASKGVTIGTAGKIGLVVFDGVTGQRLRLRMTAVSIAASTVTLFAPNRSAITSIPVTTAGAATGLLTLPATGTYQILVQPSGTNVGSMTLTLGVPDLVMTGAAGPSVAQTPDPDGTWRFPVTWSVRNQGTVSAPAPPAWRDRVFLSTSQAGTPSDLSIGLLDRTSPLAVGDTYTSTTFVTVPSSTPPATYWLRVATDTDRVVAESNEDNNAGPSIAQVILASAPPDLTVTSVVVPSGTVAPQAGDGTWRFDVTWTVQNLSQGAAPGGAAWKDRIFISATQAGDASDVPIGELTRSGGLAGSASYSRTHTVTVPASWTNGAYWIRVKTDAALELPEVNEDNNVISSARQATLGPKPNLVVLNVAGPTAAVARQPDGSWVFTVTGSVRNVTQGMAPATVQWVDRIYLSTQQGGTASDLQIAPDVTHQGGLGGGQVYTGPVTATVPSSVTPGRYWIRVKTDATNVLAEVSDDDNWGSAASTVTLGPDLTMVAGTWPSPVARNANNTWQFPITATIRNIGASTAPTATWSDRAYISSVQGGTGSDPVIGTLPHVGGLAAGASYTAAGTVTVPNTVLPGEYWIRVKTDHGSELAEADEGNNVGVSLTKVTLLP